MKGIIINNAFELKPSPPESEVVVCNLRRMDRLAQKKKEKESAHRLFICGIEMYARWYMDLTIQTANKVCLNWWDETSTAILFFFVNRDFIYRILYYSDIRS